MRFGKPLPTVALCLAVFLVGCSKRVVLDGKLEIMSSTGLGHLIARGRQSTNGLTISNILPQEGYDGIYDDLVAGRPTLHILAGTNSFDITEDSRPIILKCLRPTDSESVTVEFDRKKSSIQTRGNQGMIIQYAVKPLMTVNSYRFTCDKKSESEMRVRKMELIP